MPYNTFPTVQNVIDAVSQDVRTQLQSKVGSPAAQLAALVDYTNRTHKQILRFSRWNFLKSQPLYFITQKGQSAYWVGPTGQGPSGVVETGLNLPDMYQIRKDSVFDLSNQQAIKWLSTQPGGPNLQDRTGANRPGLPAVFRQDLNIPNILFIYPPPNNENNTIPAPQVPVVQTTAGGALPVRTYILKVTFVDSLGGESTSTTVGAPLFIAANNLAVVKSPSLGQTGMFPEGFSVAGVQYNRYNVYAVQATLLNGVVQNEGSETLQNGGSGPIPFGTDWIEPTSGLITSGPQAPLVNKMQPIGGYIVRFDYFKNRIALTQTTQSLQVPDDYFDVVVNGVNAYAFRILGKRQESAEAYQLYQRGLTEMIWDKNLFPEGVEFMRPDTNTYVNTQILGYLDPFF